MKATIFDIQRFCYKDGPGIRTMVFFKGCPLRCKWCHNPESQSPKPQPMFDRKTQTYSTCGYQTDEDALIEIIMRDVDFYEQSGGGVTLSGGEVLVQADFAASLLKKLRERGIHTAIETCGFSPYSEIEKLVPFVNLFMYDIKIITPEVHKKYTGTDNQLILENFRKLKEAGAEIIATIPLIRDVNTGDELHRIMDFLDSAGQKDVGLFAYNPMWVEKYENVFGKKPEETFETFTPEEFFDIKQLFKDRGFNVVE